MIIDCFHVKRLQSYTIFFKHAVFSQKRCHFLQEFLGLFDYLESNPDNNHIYTIKFLVNFLLFLAVYESLRLLFLLLMKKYFTDK